MILLILAILAFILIAFLFSSSSDKSSTTRQHYTEPTITGHVYIIDNDLFPEYVKIGMTTRSVNDRIREFNTAVPVNFSVKMDIPCPDPYSVEQDIHSVLKDYRVKNKEWFKIDSDNFNELMLTLPYFESTKEEDND